MHLLGIRIVKYFWFKIIKVVHLGMLITSMVVHETCKRKIFIEEKILTFQDASGAKMLLIVVSSFKGNPIT